MANATNQFYYADNGRPILKTEYDDGSEDFYDASAQFQGHSFSHLQNGEVFDPYADIAQAEADQQAGQANRQNNQQGNYANTIFGGSTMPTPFSQPNLDDPSSMRPAQAGNVGVTPGTPPGTPRAPGGPSTPAAPGGPPGADPANAANMQLYDWAGNPRQAMLNAMAKSGQKFELTNNPYVDRLLSAAPGLAMSFMAQRGLGGANETATGPSFGEFGEFLKSALNQGQVFNTVSGASGMFPQMANAVRSFQQAGQSGGDANDPRLQNPFIRQLAALFTANAGQGALTSYGQLQAPMMSGAMQRPFSDIQDSRYTNAASNFFSPGGGDPARQFSGGNDWFKYLFGY